MQPRRIPPDSNTIISPDADAGARVWHQGATIAQDPGRVKAFLLRSGRMAWSRLLPCGGCTDVTQSAPSASAQNASLDAPARSAPPSGLYRIITDEGDGQTWLWTADYRRVAAFRKPALDAKPSLFSGRLPSGTAVVNAVRVGRGKLRGGRARMREERIWGQSTCMRTPPNRGAGSTGAGWSTSCSTTCSPPARPRPTSP